MNQLINEELLRRAYSWEQYSQLVQQLVAAGKTTGPDQSEFMVNYTKLNLQRMQRVEKTVKMEPELVAELAGLEQSWHWLVLTEAWCGDAAQSLPALYRISQQSPNISFSILLRDEHLPLMDAHLTNGGRAIPVLICLDAHTLEEKGWWGPRPAVLQKTVKQLKSEGLALEEIAKQVQQWYNEDKSKSLQQEILQLVRACKHEPVNS